MNLKSIVSGEGVRNLHLLRVFYQEPLYDRKGAATEHAPLMLAAPSPRRGDRPSVGTGRRERAPEKKSAFQYRHPPFPPSCLPRNFPPLVSPLLPGNLNIIRTRGQRFEEGGIAVEKDLARKGG